MEYIIDISKQLYKMKSEEEIKNFLLEVLTNSEAETLSKRWQILNLLVMGKSQREIAKELKVSLCKVTRGSKILKTKNSVTHKILKEISNENRN